MARVKVTLPEKFIFQTKIPIRITDINYGGHVGNDSILSLIHEVRVQFIQYLGFRGEVDIDGCGIIMSDVAISYKSEVFHGEILYVEVGVLDINKYGCDIVYKLNRATDNKVAALAKTGIVFYDYANRRLANMPEKFYTKVAM